MAHLMLNKEIEFSPKVGTLSPRIFFNVKDEDTSFMLWQGGERYHMSDAAYDRSKNGQKRSSKILRLTLDELFYVCHKLYKEEA